MATAADTARLALAGPAMHAVFRFSAKLPGLTDVVEEHQRVLDRAGAVWWGKLGVPLGLSRVDAFNAQIANEIATYVYLVQNIKHTSLDVYRGRALLFAFSVETNPTALPRLYSAKNLADSVGVWVLLTDLMPIASDRLAHLRVSKTNTPLPYALRSSMSGKFIVRDAS